MNLDRGIEALLNPGEAEDFLDFASIPTFELVAGAFSRANALWLAELAGFTSQHPP